ncbi:MAG: ABC transporter permease [Candidatus Omnitrophota bacterium]
MRFPLILNGSFLKFLRQAAFYVSLLLLWKFLFMLRLWPSHLFPSPEQVFETLWSGIKDHTLLDSVGVTMRRIFLGYLLSVFFGVLLGFCIGKIKILDETIGSLFVGIQTLPSICFLPLAMVWFGVNEIAIQFVIVTGSFLSIAIATDSGVKSVHSTYLSAGRNMGAQGANLFFHVVFPASFPSILMGLKQGWIFAWRSLMAAEMLFVSLGLGYLLNEGRQLNDMSRIIAVILVIITIGITIDNVFFGTLEKRVRKVWGLER